MRFSYDTRRHKKSKIFQEVKYPKTLLLPVNDEERISSGRQRTKSLSYQLEACGEGMDADYYDVYSLCSLVIHSGTSSDNGHYYCYARTSVPKNAKSMYENPQNCSNEDEIDFLEDKWFLFDDDCIYYETYNSFRNVMQKYKTDTAYVLLYHKIDTAFSGSVFKTKLRLPPANYFTSNLATDV